MKKWGLPILFVLVFPISAGSMGEAPVESAAGSIEFEGVSPEVFEEGLLNAAEEFSEIIDNALTRKGLASERSEFSLTEIELGFSINAEGGFVLWNVGAEAGVVLHYTKEEDA